MKITAEPRSDQWNADDFIGGPRTFSIAGVKVGTAEQKYDIELAKGDGRSWRPPLTMLRLLIAAWGDEAATWTGRRVTLYRDESVRFGADAVGGIRVSHMSHLPGNKPFTAKLTTTRGRRANFTVEPLPDEPPPPPATTDPDAITKPQLQKLSILRQEKGYPDTDDGRQDWFRMVQTNTGRLVATNKDLSKAEASVLIDVLESDGDPK